MSHNHAFDLHRFDLPDDTVSILQDGDEYIVLSHKHGNMLAASGEDAYHLAGVCWLEIVSARDAEYVDVHACEALSWLKRQLSPAHHIRAFLNALGEGLAAEAEALLSTRLA